MSLAVVGVQAEAAIGGHGDTRQLRAKLGHVDFGAENISIRIPTKEEVFISRNYDLAISIESLPIHNEWEFFDGFWPHETDGVGMLGRNELLLIRFRQQDAMPKMARRSRCGRIARILPNSDEANLGHISRWQVGDIFNGTNSFGNNESSLDRYQRPPGQFIRFLGLLRGSIGSAAQSGRLPGHLSHLSSLRARGAAHIFGGLCLNVRRTNQSVRLAAGVSRRLLVSAIVSDGGYGIDESEKTNEGCKPKFGPFSGSPSGGEFRTPHSYAILVVVAFILWIGFS